MTINKKQKLVLIIAMLISGVSIIVWLAYGGEIFTKTQVLIEQKDELFPEMTYQEWVPRFIWGLDLRACVKIVIVISTEGRNLSFCLDFSVTSFLRNDIFELSHSLLSIGIIVIVIACILFYFFRLRKKLLNFLNHISVYPNNISLFRKAQK